jgi:hypothetical protein
MTWLDWGDDTMITKEEIISALQEMEEEYVKETIIKKDGREKDANIIWQEEFDMPANPLTVLMAYGLNSVADDTLDRARIRIRSAKDPRREHSLMSRDDQRMLKDVLAKTGITMAEVIAHVREMQK